MTTAPLPAHLSLLALVGYLLLANGLAYSTYSIGARRSVLSGERMPRLRLLAISLLGGALGANIALVRITGALQRYPLKVTLRVIFLGQVMVIAAFASPIAPQVAQGIATVQAEIVTPVVQFAFPQEDKGPQRVGPEAQKAPTVLGWDATRGQKTGPFGTAQGGITFIPARH